MSNSSKILRGLIALAIAAGLGTLIGWLATRSGDVAPVAVAPLTNQVYAVAQTPAPQPAPAPMPMPAPDAMPSKIPAQLADNQTGASSDWDQKLEDVLLGDDDENSKANKLLALIPLAPPEHKVELAQNLINMVQDSNYDGTAGMLTNADTPSDVSTVLMNDLLNRSYALKLPLLLDIARNPAHPLAGQALDLLGLLTQEDKGTNWDDWSTTIDTWLQENPQ